MSPFISSSGLASLVLIFAVSVRPPDQDGDVTLVTSPRGVHQRAAFVQLEEVERNNATRAPEPPAAGGAEVADVNVRPAGKGPTIVNFGVTVRAFYNADLAAGTYTADLVLAFKWTDPRTKGLSGAQDTITYTAEDAKTKVWDPQMVVSNRNLQGIEQLSSVVICDKTGTVRAVQRVLAVMKNQFDVSKFPFDTQVLTVITSSSKYMFKDVNIKEFASGEIGISNVTDAAFTGKDIVLKDFKADNFEEGAGTALHKSRGRLEVTVKRKPGKFFSALLSPCLLLLSMSYSVFWFPLLTPFVMPRVATCAITYMALMQVSGKYDAMIGGAGESWGDAFIACFSALLFLTVMTNVGLEFTSHQLKQTEFATQINTEMKTVYPIMSVVGLGVCSTLGWGATPVLGFYCAWAGSVYQRMIAGEIMGPAPKPAEEPTPKVVEDAKGADPKVVEGVAKAPELDPPQPSPQAEPLAGQAPAKGSGKGL